MAPRDGFREVIRRAYVGAVNLLGFLPEVMLVDVSGKAQSAEAAHVMPFPGCVVVPPPLCNVVVAMATGSGDPVIVAGTASVVAQAAIMALARTMPLGGIVIADPVAGTSGLTITSTGIDLFGNVTVNGAGIPT